MAITAETRRCSACPELLDAGVMRCPSCGREQAPLLADWPEGARRLLLLCVIDDAIALKIDSTEQQMFEWLLENTMRGRRQVKGGPIPYAASAADCFREFLVLREQWIAAGSPTDFAAFAQLRGARR